MSMYQNIMLKVELQRLLIKLTRVQILALVPGGDQRQHIDTATDTSAWISPVEQLHSEWPLRARALATAYCCSSEDACSTHAGSKNTILCYNTREVFTVQILNGLEF